MRIGRLIFATALVTTSAVLLASPANAVSLANLNPAHVGATAAGFQQECNSPFPAAPGVHDGWHFVLPSSQGDAFVSMTLQFSAPVGVVGPITSTSSAAPSTNGTTWAGYFDNAGPDFKHAYVSTQPAGATLLGGTAQITPDGKVGSTFNLSHTCAGTPGNGPFGSPPPSPSVTPAPSGGAETGGGGSFGFNLLGVGALSVAGAMGVLLFLRRRRDDVA